VAATLSGRCYATLMALHWLWHSAVCIVNLATLRGFHSFFGARFRHVTMASAERRPRCPGVPGVLRFLYFTSY